MRRFLVALCCSAPALILAGEEKWWMRESSNQDECKLGPPLDAHLSSFKNGKFKRRKQIQTSKGASRESKQLPPIDPKILEHSSQALDFLKSCNYKFIENYVDNNHDKPKKMNPILKTLKMHSPMDWEVLSEGTVMEDLNSDKTKGELESCISLCNRVDEAADFFDNSYEELLEDFVQKDAESSKPDYACPKCVRYLPANLLVDVPDVMWGLKSKPKPTTTTQVTTTTEAATTNRPTSVSPTTASEAVTVTGDSRTEPETTPSKFVPPKVTRTVKCGLRNSYPAKQGSPGRLLYDPEDHNRFLSSNIVFGNRSDQGEFPWQVSLRNKDDKKTYCGGTLINSWTVLTAAHCVADADRMFLKEKFVVALGWQKSSGGKKDILEDKKYGKQVMNINLKESANQEKGRVFVHPGYIGEYPDSDTNVHSPNDIAIIVLPREVTFPENAEIGDYWDDHNPNNSSAPRGTFVRPICMPDLVKKKQVQVRTLHPWTFEQSVIGDKDNVWITGFGMANKTDFSTSKKIMKHGLKTWQGQSEQLMKAYIG